MKASWGRRGFSAIALVVLLATCAWVVLGASVALADPHTLVHVGPGGLVAYNPITKVNTTLVPGMPGTWFYAEMSPYGTTYVTATNYRTDRAYETDMYWARPSDPNYYYELTITDSTGWVGMTSFDGWLDEYRAVFTQIDPADMENGEDVQIVRDIRNPGVWSYFNGTVTYPSTDRKPSAGDNKYKIQVSKDNKTLTIRRRSNKKVVGKFHVPGASGSWKEWEYYDGSVSPDGKYVAFETWKPVNPAGAAMMWRVYVCKLSGASLRRVYNNDGGFMWR